MAGYQRLENLHFMPAKAKRRPRSAPCLLPTNASPFIVMRTLAALIKSSSINVVRACTSNQVAFFFFASAAVMSWVRVSRAAGPRLPKRSNPNGIESK
jgi:hypothetical protein